MWASHTLFLVRLLLGRTIGWDVQARDDHLVPWSLAARHLWPHTMLGLAPIVLLAIFAPSAVPYALFMTAGPLLSIPLAVVTASPTLGRALIAAGIDRLPEETAPPSQLANLKLPAIELSRQFTTRQDKDHRRRAGESAGGGLRAIPGVVRSLRIYYGDRERREAMHRLYGRFVRAGDLVFDIGAHVGDRVGAFRRLGARVVAVEPQPALVKTLRLLYCFDQAVTIEPIAAGAHTGTLKLMLNIDNPSAATASDAFIAAANGALGWHQERWTKTIMVPVTTLDMLVARHGTPAFVKIDVEGLEADVLAGLTRPVPALSFEFTTIQPQAALAAISRCVKLGYDRFNVIIGERHILIHPDWQSPEEIAAWLAALPMAANSGDIYALQASAISNQ
jgi:FkbM family methyltransferase